MSQAMCERTEKTKILPMFQMSRHEENLILKRLEKAVEKLKEARREIREAIQAVVRMQEAGDDVADQAIAAVVEAFTSDGNLWIVSTAAKKRMKREAAKPLLLLRSDD
jgi:predicted RNA-binding Zn ribbon-like protein